MDIGKAFEVAFKRKKEKNWEKIYVVVDIHDTILRACYENEETYDYYPYAREPGSWKDEFPELRGEALFQRGN